MLSVCRFLWLNVNMGEVSVGDLLGSPELSGFCSDSAPALSPAALGRRGAAGRYRESEYKYTLAATTTETSPIRERIFLSFLSRTQLLSSMNEEETTMASHLFFFLMRLFSDSNCNDAILPPTVAVPCSSSLILNSCCRPM